MIELIDSNTVHAEIDQLLLTGRASNAHEAEAIYLDSHLQELSRLTLELDERAFAEHEAIKLLFSHGSRPWEDSLR